MNPERPPLNERGQILFERALRILPGLLASGHFTGPADENEGCPWVMGEKESEDDWREYSLRRWNTHAIGEAINLAQELEDAAWTATDPHADEFCEARAKEFAERQEAYKAKRTEFGIPPAT